MTKELPISIRAYAKQLNVDEKAVRKAIDEKKIVKGYNKKIKKIIPSKANAEWGNLHQVIKPQRGVSKVKVAQKLEKQLQKKTAELPVQNEKNKTEKNNSEDNSFDFEYSYEELIAAIKPYPDMDYMEAQRQREILSIAGERMKLEEQRSLLVRKADVQKNLFAIGDSLKKALLNISNRCIDDIMSAPNKIEATNILNMELNQVLNQFAQKLQTA